MNTRKKLAEVAKEKALMPFHGYLDGQETNLQPLVRLFPKWNVKEADRLWCAAFVYYCCLEAGFDIPYSPDECVSCSLAGCGGWEDFAIGDARITYFKRGSHIAPEVGDIVLYDNVFCGKEHDHIGIVVDVADGCIVAAEGNVSDTNKSGIVRRETDEHIRAFIRIPDGYKYR